MMFSSRQRQQVVASTTTGRRPVDIQQQQQQLASDYSLRSSTISNRHQLVDGVAYLHRGHQQQQQQHPFQQHQRYAQTISRASNLHQMIPLLGPQQQSAAMRLQQQANNQVASPYYQQPASYQQHQQMVVSTPNHETNYQSPYAYTMGATRPQYSAMMPYVGSGGELPITTPSLREKHSLLNKPLCRCRVMYLGSSVPHITKNGLHGIQEPLKHLYPDEQFSKSAANSTSIASESTTIDISHLSSSLGIDSWLSVWSNGLLLENVDEFGREVKRFFSIESLHYCAAVRFFDTMNLTTQDQQRQQQQQVDQQHKASSEDQNNNNNNNQSSDNMNKTTEDKIEAIDDQNHNSNSIQQQSGTRKSMVRFLPLDAPLFQVPGMVDANHPPVFASIMRRTTGIKVLECHAFICRRDAAANALVRCCTHAYADFLNAKRLSLELGHHQTLASMQGGASMYHHHNDHQHKSSLASRSKTLGAKSSRRRGDLSMMQAVGSAGTTTNNTTSNEENSLEGSSEDNYAIISRRTGAHSFATDRHKLHTTRKLGDTNEIKKHKHRRDQQRRAQRKVKGSSRSLYDDFQPKNMNGSYDVTRDPEANGGHLYQEMDKLSHSLDHLQVAARCESNGNNPDDVSYSVVRNKRHSNSMQNLDGPFTFTVTNPSVSSIRSPRSRRSRAHRRNQQSQDGSSALHNNNNGYRKAASYQDMRKNSVSSDITVRSSVAESQNNGGDMSERELYGGAESQAQANRYSIASSSTNYLKQHAPILTGERQVYVPNNSEILMGNYHSVPYDQVDSSNSMLTNQTNRTLTDSVSSSTTKAGKSSSSKRREQSCPPRCRRRAELERAYDSVLPGPTSQRPYYPMPVYGHHPQPSPYLPGFYMNPNHHHMMPPQPIYGQAPMAPNTLGGIYDAPAMNPYLPMPHYAVPPPHLVAESMYQNHQHAARIYDGLNGANTIAPIRTLKNQSKASLARFRCLSPPANFLGASNNISQDTNNNISGPPASAYSSNNNKDSNNNATSSANQPVKGDAGSITSTSGPAAATTVKGSASAKTVTENGSSPSDIRSEELDIVSAAPGFLSSATVGRGQKKMSWIKRLSLTMSNGGQSGDESDSGATGAAPSTDPNGLPVAASRKRRSGLFSGSLTLGRGSKQQHHQAKLISSPT